MRLKLGLTKPKQPILGFDTAGQVEAVGEAVTRFQPGDRVVASRSFDFGCHAEYATVGEQAAIAAIPESLSYQDAVALLLRRRDGAPLLPAGQRSPPTKRC